MANLPVYDMSGNKVGDYPVEPSELATDIKKQLLHDVVVMYQANARQGSHKTKSRAEVSGNKKKMYRQKGTGNARAGSKRTNIRRGGGHAFARQNRDYSYRLPRKALRLATRMAMAGKVEKMIAKPEGKSVVVVDGLSLDQPKTKSIANMLKGIGICGESTLITTDGHRPMIYKSARNVSGVEVLDVRDLNAYAILKPRHVVLMKGALDKLTGKGGEVNDG